MPEAFPSPSCSHGSNGVSHLTSTLINITEHPVRNPRSHCVYCLVTSIYYLDECIFSPVMFSPRQTDAGVVHSAGKIVPPRNVQVNGIN